MFKVGDAVVWTSSSQGITKQKRGIVEVVVPPKGRLSPAQKKEADAYGLPRDHESYLVRVPGKTASSRGKLYWPRVSALAPQTVAANCRD